MEGEDECIASEGENDSRYKYSSAKKWRKKLPDEGTATARGGDGDGDGGEGGPRRKRLELRLRLTMFYGYQVVGDAQPEAKVTFPKLRQVVGTLGSTEFERVAFEDAPPDHVVTAAELASW